MENIKVLYEFTLQPEEHKFPVNLRINIYRETDKKLSHGPRVKFYKNTKNDGFSISLNEDNKKIKLKSGKYENFINKSTLISLINQVRIYKIPFLNVCYNLNMTKEELINQMRMIDRGETVKLIKIKVV